MRIEKVRLGTRVRVILNRSETMQQAYSILESSGVSPDILKSYPKVFAGDSSGVQSLLGDGYYIETAQLEKMCAVFARNQYPIPDDFSSRLGLDKEGSIAGITFQFFEAPDLVDILDASTE